MFAPLRYFSHRLWTVSARTALFPDGDRTACASRRGV